jgi:predicted nucleic-acid-binding protein
LTVVDTNILIRYVVADEADPQTALARDFIDIICSAANQAIVTQVVLAELVWTLESRYRFPKAGIIATVAALLQNPNIVFDDEEEVLAALEAYRDGPTGLADCLIAARAEVLGAGPVVTFDRDAARLPGFRLLEAGA